MSDKTAIEWTDATWNPVTGCTKVSQGCRNCYAESWANRHMGEFAKDKYRKFTDIVLHHDKLSLPWKWKTPKKIFVNSMSDLFHDDVPFTFIDLVFYTMTNTPHHTYQILTKRPKRMHAYMTQSYGKTKDRVVPKNIWLGVSVEDQLTAYERIPILLETPAAVWWLSMEPLLGEVNIKEYLHESRCVEQGRCAYCKTIVGEPKENRIDWVVVGGESGRNARPMHPDWVRSIRDDCDSAGVPFFFKQWGEWAPAYDLQCNDAPYKDKLWYNFDPDVRVCRIGKKLAGSKLDGNEYKSFPEVKQ